MTKNYTFLIVCILGLISQYNFAQNTYDDGVFILNEGMAGTNTASVSFLDDTNTLSNGIFVNENSGLNIGQIAQGMGFEGDEAYIVSNGSSEVHIVDRVSFSHVATVTEGLDNPRYIEFDNGLAYVTNWGDPVNTADDFIAVINLETYTVVNNIAVAEGPEEIIKKGSKLFVGHQGGYGYGNTVSVIDLTDYSVSEITLADIPNSLEVDEDYLYVLCGGKPNWTGEESIAKLFRIDLNDYSAVEEFEFEIGQHPDFLEVEDGVAYYVEDTNIFEFDFSTTSLPTTAFITTANVQIAYGFSFIDGVFYLADVVDYVSDGIVYTYDATGGLQESYTVGLIPNGIYKYEAEDLSVEQTQEELQLAIYPNPTADKLFLTTQQAAEVSIYNLNAKLVKKATYTNNGISVNTLSTGVYLVRVQQENTQQTLKLIIK
ncbi:T9SS type A sorting domain-containing protein [Mesonia sp. MT50]|uniref:T9SS type A sorting domain-containing protein n=1 Tax=Mesonia profundi TaxID=3070998 RepID=A0ABU1A251_9FLAO|nr:T9SS type A sorting domain-containing protein [Mesonia profundi]MDQ7917783.1 T9SS type A sorting domain-containing protein [Mesonia profundi]